MPTTRSRRFSMTSAWHGGPTLALLVTLSVLPSCAPPLPTAPSVPEGWRYDLNAPAATGRNGMVATADRYATEIGLEVLRAGGNAVDASIAVSFVLAVTYPAAGNIGGGGFMLVRMNDGTTAALDYREKAPFAATHDMYLDAAGSVTDRAIYGASAAGVPGSVMGLWESHRRFGSRPWAELVAPAILLAEGFEVHESLHDGLVRVAKRIERFDEKRREGFAATIETFFPDGEPPTVGTTFSQPELAETLRRIAEQGPDGFYRGRTADLIVAEMTRSEGIITHRDLEEYTAEWRDPVVFDYRDHTVISMPPVSSGGATLAEMLNILEGFPLGELAFDSTERIHLLAETMKRGYADRNSYLGDPAFAELPVERMISKDYAEQRRAGIRPDAATPSSEVGPGLGPVDHGTDTTHFSVVDRHGNAVAVTTTINTGFGSLVTVGGAGFLLNNEMDDFAAKPGTPNSYGLVQGEVNAIAGGKRMLSSMTPTIVLDPDGNLELVTGTPGGSRIITVVMQTIINAIDHGMGVSAIINAPRVHHQHLPDRIYYEEGGLPPETIERLEALGHTTKAVDEICNVQAIAILDDGRLTGAADPRGSGVARGY